MAVLEPAPHPKEEVQLDARVACHTLAAGHPPLFIAAQDDAFSGIADVVAWIKQYRATLDRLIERHGGVVLRGFPIVSSDDFGAVVGCFPEFTGGYQGGAAARRPITKGVYEATQRTGDQAIPIHQEMFYLRDYPPRIAFFSRKVAEQGGETLIADMRAITAALPPAIRDQLEIHGIRNVRNFAAKSGNMEENRVMDRRGWDFAFYTDSEDEVEAICERRHMQPHWHEDGSLTVFNQEPAFVTHPTTGERIYRGGLHIAHFYRGSYDNTGEAARVREGQEFPSGAYLGDGSELDEAQDAQLCALVDRCTYQWLWHDGDVMLLDNLLTGHGRNPFEGTRATEVALLD
ncbi:MAG: TauD/TfdA family dioxygenase [Pseudomonadota bacterium]